MRLTESEKNMLTKPETEDLLDYAEQLRLRINSLVAERDYATERITELCFELRAVKARIEREGWTVGERVET